MSRGRALSNAVAVALVACAVACGGGSDGRTKSVDPIDFDTPDGPQSALIIMQPSARAGFVTDQSSIALSGQVLGADQFDSLWWESDSNTGELQIAGDTWTTAAIELPLGDTHFTVNGKRADGTVIDDTLNVTRNAAAAFTGPLWADPPYALVGQATDFTFHVDLDPSVSSATVVRADETGAPIEDLVELSLDGLAWSGTTTLSLSEAGPMPVRVRAKTADGDALSEVIDVTSYVRPSDDVLSALWQMVEDADTVYEQAVAQGDDDLQARSKLWTFMNQQPGIVLADPGPRGEYFHFVHETGIQFAASFAPPDVKGNPKVGVTQGVVNEQDVVKLKSVGADLGIPIEETVRAQLCPRYGFTYNDSATVAHYRSLAQYGLVVISAHGTPGGTKNFPQRDMIWTDQPASYDDLYAPDSPLLVDALAGSIAISLKVPHEYLITPKLIRTYVHGMPSSVVFNSSCHSARSGDMAKAFLGAGAGAYLGFSSSADAIWAAQLTGGYFKALMDGATTKEAYETAIDEFGLFDANPKNRFTFLAAFLPKPDLQATGICQGTTELSFKQTNTVGSQECKALSQDKLAHIPSQNELQLVERTVSCEVHDGSFDETTGVEATGTSHETYEYADDRTKFLFVEGFGSTFVVDPDYDEPNWMDYKVWDPVNGVQQYKDSCPWYGATFVTPFLDPTELATEGITLERDLGTRPGTSGTLRLNYEFTDQMLE